MSFHIIRSVAIVRSRTKAKMKSDCDGNNERFRRRQLWTAWILLMEFHGTVKYYHHTWLFGHSEVRFWIHRIYIYICVYICIHICVRVYIYICICIYMYTYICVCIIYVCIHIYICMYTYIYMYVYLYNICYENFSRCDNLLCSTHEELVYNFRGIWRMLVISRNTSE
jgi:hypothetical protein